MHVDPDQNVGGWLTRHAAERPEAPAIIENAGGALSYAALNTLANRAAHVLGARGIERGDRIALALRSEPLYLAIYFAAAKLGAVVIPLNTRLTATELEFQIADAGARLTVRAPEIRLSPPEGCGSWTDAQFRDALPPTADEPDLAPGGEAPQVILYTSGTTGVPKGAVLPHRKTLYNSLNAAIFFGLRPDDVVVTPVPLFHSFGLKILSVPALFVGATVVLVDRFDPIGLQDTIAARRATVLGAVPVMYRRMLEAGVDARKFASLRFAFSAGAALDIDTIVAYDAMGIALKQGYGQTETSILCCLDAADAVRKAGSVGRPVTWGEVRIANERGETSPRGVAGEVVVRGPIVMTGYWRRPEETEASRIGGWHRTGDLGVMDEEGYVTLVGRRKELYISGGENVYPAEVERVLESHAKVVEAAVAGVPDTRWGETGRAFVVRGDTNLDADTLLAWAGERLASFKLPRDIVWVDELPRTASGKVQKHVLLEQPPPSDGL